MSKKNKKDEVFDLLNGSVKGAMESYDLEHLYDFMASFNTLSRRSSWFAAEIFYTIREKRLELGLWDDWQKIVSEKTGYSPVIVKRYADLWEVYISVPEEYKPGIKKLGVGRAVPLISLHNEGLLTNAVLESIIENPNRISDIAREVKGELKFSDSLSIYMDQTGVLYAIQGDLQSHPVIVAIGNLDLRSALSHSVGKVGIQRVIDKAHIKRLK
jgi:hypothetical protein